MSGHFLLLNIETRELDTAKKHKATWSKAIDDHAPWNNASRQVLQRAQRGEKITRKELPPHRYLECAYANRQELHKLFKSAPWVKATRLSRPGGGDNMGLKKLHADAQKAWDQGQILSALTAQLDQGYDVTLEVYYLDSLEIG